MPAATGKPPPVSERWGCSQAAHDKLGWCCHCPGLGVGAEVLAWRLLAATGERATLDMARAWTTVTRPVVR